jgi:Fe-S-cluster-containing dehydrogenase component
MKILRATRIERCIGCHSCSLACARLVHKQLSWTHAGIRVISAGGMSTGFEARLCLACDPAPCVAACPTQSLTQRPGGGVKQNREICIRCGECRKACPAEAIHIDDTDGAPYVCLHCGRCIAFCPHECLEMLDIGQEKGVPVEGVDSEAATDSLPAALPDAPKEADHAA